MATNSITTLNLHHSLLNNRRKNSKLISLSFSPHRRRHRRNSLRNPSKPNQNYPNLPHDHSSKLQFILDVDQLKSSTPVSIIERRINEFFEGGIEAYDDLRSLVRVEQGCNRVIVSCSEKTVWFLGGVLVWSFVGGLVIRVLLGLGLRVRGGFGKEKVIVRRDRSLGGKEVVVAKMSGVGRNLEREMAVGMRKGRVERRKKLPDWWPVVVVKPGLEGSREESLREAKAIVRAIMDDKLRGMDVSEEAVLELRRVCRRSGVQLSFETDNSRDSLYRLSVHNVISRCCRAGNPLVQIDGEDARLFLAGLAYDVGLDNFRAATIVSATVAAQTRQWFLQAWALEMQAKYLEAMGELRKICLIHRIFPPEPSSPEMEMVARGLQTHLSIDQREFLLTKLISVCGNDNQRSAAEALGLV